MKEILIILAALSMTNCKTYNITFQEAQEKPVATVYIPKRTVFTGNVFEKQFHEADSVFQIIKQASNEAARSAHEKTKHLIPWNKY